jgi:hypothetical protein
MAAVLMAAAQAPAPTAAKTASSPGVHPHSAPAAAGPAGSSAAAPPAASAPAAAAAAVNPAERTDCYGGNCNFPSPHISIATPAPAPSPWPLQDRIAWGANVLLAIMAYVGIMLAISMLRKIERQTRYAEAAAQAAAESAQAALLHAQAIARAERPWILVSAEPSRTVENGFVVVATNRGRSPARIESLEDAITSAADEEHLPGVPEYAKPELPAPVSPIILLPGESTRIKFFRRDDVRGFCGTEEKFKQVEDWEEKVFLYGRISYVDFAAPDDAHTHETLWCCWYIHGRQKSGMVMAGTPAYNKHT